MISPAPSPSSAPLGIGVYSFADAARFIGTESREIRRWLLGHRYRQTGADDITQSVPLWTPELARFDIADGIGFRDLLELRFVKAFRRYGVSLLAIRRAIEYAGEKFDSDRPFQCKRFQTDGYSIFVTVKEETGDESLIDVVRRQQTFREVIGPSLYSGIEFDGGTRALRWFPAGGRAIVLDPARNFGQPILTKAGIPTVAVAESLAAEGGDAHLVARLFGITRREVDQAAQFEANLTRH
jgi:uncharacterized protein (DUF433 family)